MSQGPRRRDECGRAGLAVDERTENVGRLGKLGWGEGGARRAEVRIARSVGLRAGQNTKAAGVPKSRSLSAASPPDHTGIQGWR